jgi:hypothetical protein
MATSITSRAQLQASGGEVSTQGRSSWRRVLRPLWDALAEMGKQRAHREVAYLLQARGGEVTGDFDRDLQRYIELSTARMQPRQTSARPARLPRAAKPLP